MKTRSDDIFLKHILAEIEFILAHCRGLHFDDFISDPVLQRAVVRSLEIIGEAAKNLSAELKAKNPQVEWHRMAAMRDVLIHKYFGVDWEVVWEVIQNKLPQVGSQLQTLPEAEDESGSGNELH